MVLNPCNVFFATIVCDFFILKTHVCNVITLCIFLFIIQHHVTYELKECNIIMQNIAKFCNLKKRTYYELFDFISFLLLAIPTYWIKKSTLCEIQTPK